MVNVMNFMLIPLFLVKSSKIHDFLGILGGSSHFLSDLYYPNLSYTFGEFA